MTPAAHLWVFFGLVVGIILLPGLDMACVLGCTLGGGRRAGLASIGGIVTAALAHVAIGGLGLAALDVDARPVQLVARRNGPVQPQRMRVQPARRQRESLVGREKFLGPRAQQAGADAQQHEQQPQEMKAGNL